MKVKNINASSRKTQKKIKQVFAELMAEKRDLANITVTELSERADITRSSFYNHYDSIYDVAQDLQNETLDILSESLKRITSLAEINNLFDEVIAYLKENEKIYSLILSSNSPLYFTNRLNILLNKMITDSLINTNHEDLILKATFFSDGCMELIVKYFRKEINFTLDEINIFIKDIFKKIFL